MFSADKTFRQTLRHTIAWMFGLFGAHRIAECIANPPEPPKPPVWARLDLVLPPLLEQQLDELPSETTALERRLLWHFFSTIWDGQGDVIEIGPFLGGTSRAIALGMMANCRYQGGKLRTFDRFEKYYDEDTLLKFLSPLHSKGLLSTESLTRIGTTASFRKVFDEIHSPFEYGKIIIPYAKPLPDVADDIGSGTSLFKLPDNCSFSAIFVDGCKSWFGTKSFMKECCPTARPGSFFIFQDYTWYTCFWVPSFVYTFRPSFRLICHVDNTYAFQLISPISAIQIDQSFFDTPEEMGKVRLTELFDAAQKDALLRSDADAELRHAIQFGGALAYIGELDQAREWFKALALRSLGAKEKSLVNQASKEPTYRPGDKVIKL